VPLLGFIGHLNQVRYSREITMFKVNTLPCFLVKFAVVTTWVNVFFSALATGLTLWAYLISRRQPPPSQKLEIVLTVRTSMDTVVGEQISGKEEDGDVKVPV